MATLSRKVLNWYAKLTPSRGKAVPPYEHVIQIGDPRLRKICEPVSVSEIKSEEIQKVLTKLNIVLHKYSAVGMAAPQIGINKRIFMMKLTKNDLSQITPDVIKSQGISLVPFTIFINPEMKVMEYQKILFNEGCASIRGYSADVPRYKQVQVSAYNAAGEKFTQIYKDWAARIVQHEMDHLDGKLYVDTMDRKSLQCVCWEEVNKCYGKVKIPLG